MIEINNINHTYKQRKGPPRQALRDIILSVPPKTLFALTGPNGGGKSTLFRILTGLLRPSNGLVRMNGMNIHDNSHKVRALMGVVFQQPALDKHLTVMENFQIHADLYDLPSATMAQSLEEDLTWAGLKDRLNDRVGALSGGMQRRAELVKALLHRPPILLMDEPTTGLDPGARHAFWEAILHFRDHRGLTILTTTHLFDEAERADHVSILHQGRVLAVGTPDELSRRLGSEMVVIRTMNPEQAEALQKKLEQRPGVTVLRQGGEVRVEGVDQEMVEELLSSRKDIFKAISIKRPTLQDFFIHITKQDLETLP